MKRILTIFFAILIIFTCINVVNAEDIIQEEDSNDNLTLILNDSLVEDSSHIHTNVSDLISDSPVKAATINAPGGTFTQLQNIINSASSGDTISLTGDYTYNSGFTANGISINKNLNFVGNGHTIDASRSSVIFSLGNYNFNYKFQIWALELLCFNSKLSG